MTAFVESLKRLYSKGSKSITKEKLESLVEERKITQEDFDYITKK